MTDRTRIMAPFALLRGLQFHHQRSGAAFYLVPWPKPQNARVDAARQELFDIVRAALPEVWRIEPYVSGPVQSLPKEPYVRDVERHRQRIDDMTTSLRDAGIIGAEQVSTLPAGWLVPMEGAVDGIVAVLRDARPPATMKTLQIKEKFAMLRSYASASGEDLGLPPISTGQSGMIMEGSSLCLRTCLCPTRSITASR